MLKRLLSNVKLLPKILLVGIIITGCSLAALGYVYVHYRESKWDAKRTQTRNLVLAAYESAERYVDLADAGAMSEEEAQAAAKEAVRAMRYENDNYFWINDLEPKMIMHPNYAPEEKPEWYETDGLVNYTDPTGKRLFVAFVEVAEEKGQGYVDYQWTKPGSDSDKPVPKVSYVKLLPEWDWIIGTGVYADDVQTEMAAVRRTMLGIGGGMAALSIIFSFVVARSISGPLQLIVTGAEQIAQGDPDMTGLDYEETLEVSARRDELGEVGRSIGKLEDYFRAKTEAAEEIARGNLAVEVPVASDQDSLGRAMVQMKQSISGMADSVQGLIKAAVAGKLDTRADASEFEGEYHEIVGGMNQTLDAVIGPLNVAAEYVDRIGKGDIPEKIADEYQGDFNEIKNNLNACIDGLGGLVEANAVLQRMAVNDYSEQVEGTYQGVFADVGTAVNQVRERLLHIQDTALNIAAGDLSDLDEYKAIGNGTGRRSDNDEIVPAFIAMMEALDGLVDEMHRLTEATVEGRLDTRGDTNKFSGDFAAVVEGVNDTLDAVIAPLNVTAEYVDRISKGDIPQKIRDDYKGDFNEIKNNLNGLIDSLNGLTAHMSMMYQEQRAGEIEAKIDAGRFMGVYREVAEGYNEAVHLHINNILRILEILGQYAEGDFSEQLEELPGKQRVANERMDLLRDNLLGLIEEIEDLTEAAAAGNLEVRADVSGFQGEYRHIAGGINRTLDAVAEPLRIIGLYLQRIAVGDLKRKITVRDEQTNVFKGDWMDYKENVNQCIDNVSALVDDANMLAASAVEGRLDVRADESRHEGAYRELIQGVNAMLDAVVEPMQTVSQAMTRVAAGDLTVKMNGKYRGDYAKLSESVDTMVLGLREMAGTMQEGAMNISSATSEILASSSQMASTTREQASAVNEVTSTVEEIQSSAEQVAQRAQGVAEAAQEAARAAQDGSMAADEAIAAMSDIRQRVDAIAENILSLSEQTQQIGEIIDTVTDIADQSNILALNAAIEAAQAGEAGKGFRVVADEVRSLAEQSRQAAAQVKVILGDIQEASNRAVMATEQGTKQVAAGSDQVERTAQTIRELSSTVEQSSHASEQIVAGVQQQTVGLDQIAVGMTDINQAAQQAAAGAEQSEKAAQDLDKLGGDLEETVDQYKM